MSKEVHIVGAGPSGLYCAYLLLENGFEVHLYDQKSGVGKKFLVAGNGGLNLTHSEDLEKFVEKYGENTAVFTRLISEFSPEDLRAWCKDLGVETFIGSSGRVFPKTLKAAQLLSLWLEKLKSSPKFHLHLKHRLTSITKDGELSFYVDEKSIDIKTTDTILCLGGGSWKKTGSDGLWVNFIEKLGVQVKEFRSMNCGFSTDWSKEFLTGFEDDYLKNIAIEFSNQSIRGELMLTSYGIEGGGIYAHSSNIQKYLLENGKAQIFLDLKPSLSREDVLKKLSKPRGKNSLSNFLRKSLNLSKLSIKLIRELVSKEECQDQNLLADKIKRLPITLREARPIDESISTGGGVIFDGLDEDFKVHGTHSIFLIGEMLDWEAPTGGYLLQGCFSMAHHTSKSIISKYS
ncbi:hypothetical protein BIY24_05650 [Halobacteriovorax marinus]|uniref:TIGR03862 family flavoprotein n=1 Tax=Halobacteriovorax marinus TaxID=97084 RepID=UPI000BC35761|nr:TIGR03862 family flavoprotein [Halobacteriovorax marinus]ATH07443.1 hypothetical protein BIY24_05650 [Halobacteriovorax marinus]